VPFPFLDKPWPGTRDISMAATKLQANWTAVSLGTTSITRVSQASFSQGGSLASYSADAISIPRSLSIS